MVSLRSTADAATVGVSLPGFYLDEKELSDRRTYDVISAPGGGTHQVGRPDLPVFGEMILVPNGATPILEVEPGEALVVESLDIAPLQPPPTDAGRQPFAKDQGLYAGDADFPSVFAFLEPLARIRGRQASILWLYPYRYNPARRRLLIFPDLRVTVRFEGRRRGVAARLKSRPFDRLLGRVMINADAVLAGGEEVKSPRTSSGTEKIRASGTEGACEYLIVTHPDFLEAASALAAWKRKSGFSTFVATTSDTGDTAEEIAAYLQGAYDTWDPAPTYVLFIGDAEFIPTFYRTAHPNSGSLVGTDLYYATLDGSDYFPDIITGRISVDTAEQALKRVNDIIGYESDPVTDESFYASAAICAQFQHYTNGYAERRFAQTSEDLAIYLSDPAYLGQYSVERFYYTGSAVTPLYWSVFYFSGGPAGDAGDPIPSYLEKPGFAWDADAADISAAVNSGRFLLTHRDHGSATAWGSPYYSTSHVSALTNGEKLPVVWSVNCSTGFFDKETCANPASTVSFSEAWERNPSGGAAGVIAATRVSYSGHNDRLFWGWADAVWPDFVTGFSGPEISYRRMGDVLNYGKLYYATRYSESTYRKVEFEIFHWFGDPAMMIRTRLPETLAVSHPARVVQGVPVDFEVTVESGGSFVAGAAVAVYREDVPGDYRTAQTDETGTALFPGLTASEIGEYELVVTAPETIPYQGAFVALAAPSPTPAPSPSPSPVPWPGGWGTEIGASLPDGFEPSGLVWHERLGVLFIVGDGGQVVQMDEEGGEVVVWNPGGDLEGIAVADPASNYLYLGVEDPDSIREFNLAAGTLTGRSWSLTEWMSGPSNSGLEALTFVPNGHHPYPASASGGLFYAGLQADGKIYVFDVDLSAGESLSYVDTIVPVSGQTDLSGLHYHRENRTLYAVFDGADLLREMEADGTLIVEYPLAGNTQEGVALKPSCPSPATSLFIAEDAGNEIWRYDDYPVSCLAATPTPPAPTPGPSRTPVPPPTVPATSTPTGAPPGYCRQPLALNDITDARIGITRSSYNYGYKYEIFSAEEPGHDNRWFYLYDRVNVYHDGPGVPGSYLKLGIYADADYRVEEGDWINLTGLDWSDGVVNVNIYPPPAPLPLDEWTYYYIAADGSLYNDRELCDLAVAAPNGTPLPSPTAPPAATPPGYCRQPLALNDITDARIGITRSSYNYGYKYEIFSAEEPGHDNRWFYLYDRLNVYHDDPGVPGSYLKLGIYADADYRVEQGDWINLTGLDWSGGVVNVNVYPPPAPLPLDEWTYYYIAADGSLYHDRELCDLAVAAPNGTPLPSPTAPPATTPLPTVSPVLTPTETPEQVIIVCLGDSVTHGAPYADNGNPHLTYPARLSVLLEAGYGEGGFAVHNQGVNGYRAEDVVNDLLQPGALDEDPDYVLLMIGGNDLAGATIGNIFQVIEETTWEVQSCVNLVKSHTNPDGSSPRVILSAFIPNLVEDGWGTLAVGFYNNSLLSNLEGYDLWTGENWEDLYDPDTGEAKQSLMFDDVHPNSDGYQVLAENWFNAIQTMLPASPTPAPGSSP